MARRKRWVDRFEDKLWTAGATLKKHTLKTSLMAKSLAKKGGKQVKDYAVLVRPLNPKEKFQLKYIDKYISNTELQHVSDLIKQGKAKIKLERQDWSFLVSGRNLMPKLISKEPEIRDMNTVIAKNFLEERYQEFSAKSWNVIPQYIASNTLGLAAAKRAAMLLLFSDSPIHTLLIGENSAKDVLVSAQDMAIDNTTIDKLENGFACASIDTFKLARKKQLFKNLEQGFIRKGRTNTAVKASVILCSKAEKFYKPFHLVIHLKKPKLDYFADVAEQLIARSKSELNINDVLFIKAFIRRAAGQNVSLPIDIAERIKQFAVELKRKEKKLPYAVTKKTIEGVINLAKASARLELREYVQNKDLLRVFELYMPEQTN